MSLNPNAPFRALLKIGSAVLCTGLAGRLIYRTSDAYRSWLTAALVLLLLALPLGAWATRRQPGRPLLVRLFHPGRSRTAEMLHVLSFFTFADPGEVSWHAVEQSQKRGRRSPINSGFLYVCFVLPTAFLLDWLMRWDVPVLTVTSMLYLPPWVAIRAMEEAARRRSGT